MNVATAAKSGPTNWLEGLMLTTVFSALPTFTAVMLLLGLFGRGMPVHNPASFVVLTALGYAVIVAAFGAKHKLVRNSYEPLFFDSSLSVRDKLRSWLEKPRTARQVVTNMLMLSVLAIAFVSMT